MLIDTIIISVQECCAIIQKHNMKKNNFVIGIPCRNSVCSPLLDFIIENKIKNVMTENGFWVVKNRNKIIDRFLKDYTEDYLIFLDSDTVPKIEWVQMIIESGLKIVSIPYPFYSEKGLIMTCLNPDTNKWYTAEEYINLVKKGQYKFKETQIVGGGCLIIHRKVLQRLAKPRWEYPSEEHISAEDVLFSYKLCKNGNSVFSLVGAVCAHYKEGVNLATFVNSQNLRKKEIPKIIHQIWIGSKDIPYKEYRESIKKFHPQWQYIMWDEKRLLKEKMISEELYKYILANPFKKIYKKGSGVRDPYLKISDIVRYNILKKYGGVYLDIDIICLRSLDALIKDNEMIAGFEGEQRMPGLVGNSVIGCIPEHQVILNCVDEVYKIPKEKFAKKEAYKVTGPFLFTEQVAKDQDVAIFNQKVFYPISWERDVCKRLKNINSSFFKDSYLIHPWGLPYE